MFLFWGVRVIFFVFMLLCVVKWIKVIELSCFNILFFVVCILIRGVLLSILLIICIFFLVNGNGGSVVMFCIYGLLMRSMFDVR